MYFDGVKRSSTGVLRAGAVLITVAALLVVSGCGGSDPGEEESTPALTDPKVVLERMTTAYREAQSYQDAGVLNFVVYKGLDAVTETVPFSIAFERPGKLRLHLYQASVVSDGKQLHATINDLPQQVLQQSIDGPLTLEALYQDSILYGTLTQGLASGSMQLAMLLLDKPLDVVMTEATKVELLPSETLDEDRCYRVKMARKDGDLVFWIDEKTFVLRRAELPTKDLLKQFANSPDGEGATRIDLVVNFTGAELNAKIEPVAFEFDLAKDSRVVENFVPPPPPTDKPLPPSKLLGQKMPPFTLTALDGTPVTRDTLAGKIVILDFWFTECPNCFEAFPEMTKVYETFKDNEKVVFLTVNIDDPATHSNAQLQETFAKAGLNLPIVRDIEQHGNTVFGVEACPMTFILGPDGTVESSEVGFNPNVAVDMPAQLERLLAGESIYPDVFKVYEQRLREYEQAAANPSISLTLPENEISQKSEPARLKLTPLWNCTELTRPGNILIVPAADGTPTIYVHDGWNTVAELGTDGKVVTRHDLAIPPKSVISYLRTATDSAGKRYFVGSASSQQQLFLYDADWKQLLAFPDSEHAGIADVQLGDLDGDGQPEINVSYYGVVGIQSVALSGDRRWSYRQEVENVFRMAVGTADTSGQRKLLCVNGRSGTLLPLDANGEAGTPIGVKSRYLRFIQADDLDGDAVPELCALVPIRNAEDVAIGLSSDGQELWNYALPAGVHTIPIEPITVGKTSVDGPGHWLLAAADGSLHFLDAAGTLVDKFNYGAALSGMATCQIDGKAVLLVSSANGVDAWQISE